MVDDPTTRPYISSLDPNDDYLIAVAEGSRSILVSGDRDLLGLSGGTPVYFPDQFLDLVDQRPDRTARFGAMIVCDNVMTVAKADFDKQPCGHLDRETRAELDRAFAPHRTFPF